MPVFKSIDVHVTINSQKLPEFDDDNEESPPPNTVTKYIEAVTGAEFKIEVRSEEKDIAKREGIRYSVSLDGNEMDKGVMDAKFTHSGHSSGARSLSNGKCTLKRYKFADIVISKQIISFITDNKLITSSRTSILLESTRHDKAHR